MDDVVESTLGEGRVDVAEGNHTLLGKSAREGNGMTFGNAHIERALWHFLHHDGKAAPCCHSRRDAYDAVVLSRKLKQCLSEDVLILRRKRGVEGKQLTRFGVVLAGSMIDSRVLLGSLEALALDGVNVQKLRTFHVLYLPQRVDQLDDVVSVGRTEVADVHPLEDVLLSCKERLERIIEAKNLLPPAVAEETCSRKLLRKSEAYLII